MSEALVCFLPWLLLATIILFLAALVKPTFRIPCEGFSGIMSMLESTTCGGMDDSDRQSQHLSIYRK